MEFAGGRVRARKLALDSDAPSRMLLRARTLLTLVLNPTGTNHFYC